MLRDRIFSASILLLIFLISYLSKNPIYFLLLSFAASGILFYELAKILKLKSLSLCIYWILSFLPVIFFYVVVSLGVFFPNDSASYLKNFLFIFSVFISLISLFFWYALLQLILCIKKYHQTLNLKFFMDIF